MFGERPQLLAQWLACPWTLQGMLIGYKEWAWNWNFSGLPGPWSQHLMLIKPQVDELALGC